MRSVGIIKGCCSRSFLPIISLLIRESGTITSGGASTSCAADARRAPMISSAVTDTDVGAHSTTDDGMGESFSPNMAM
jgi:hypothetical protein